MSTIFISKDPQDLNPALQQLVQKGVLEAQSLIAFSAQPFLCPSAYDILFIASIRAADFFFAQCQTNAQIACAGLETAKKVTESYQKEVHFVAQHSDDPQLEAQQFNAWRNGRSVCFPSSQLSVGTYSSLIPEKEKIILPIYNTHFKNLQISAKDIYIFSSPSNVRAFLTNNTIAANAQVVAWGDTTAQELAQNQISVTKILNGQQQADLLNWLNVVR